MEQIMKETFESYFSCLKLNMKMAVLALANKWISSSDIGSSYDKIASSCDASWQRHLQTLADELIEKLPPTLCGGNILDLGCGDGHASRIFSEKYPKMKISGVDISLGMLLHARRSCYGRKDVFFIKSDMLDYMRHEPTQSAALIFSSWSAGYSKPFRIIKEARRILKRGGRIAVVTSLSDSMQPLFEAYRSCMAKYPEKIKLALWRDFPTNAQDIRESLEKCGFVIRYFEDNYREVSMVKDGNGDYLPWLLKTGIMAGFDKVLKFGTEKELGSYFESQLKEIKEPMKHHYVSFIAEI